MLTYHPAFDLYNAVFRALRLLEALPRQEIELERLRVLDFYLLFPFLLADIEFPALARKYKKHFVNRSSDYENIANARRLFVRLEPYQVAALQCLASYSLVDAAPLAQNKVQRTHLRLPDELQNAIATRNRNSIEVELLTGAFAQMDFYGVNGLKSKSNLFECRYDLT